ncbi:uncharacterized protein LOC127290862 isoform X2 [Leptopilina boulardi]|uniref:uncharacterized protein LOC127290862 isoform X2 n=1 Tax=Leptopilina boulardi TaxID=63433 RepID=UPI0021F6276B|nr:uncharacterized protein LOC127290862 isoform X2 [Leptopilina boulardi]
MKMKIFRNRMSLYSLLQLILITLYCKAASCQDISENTSNQNLIDPHSFYYNRHRKEMQKPINDGKKISTEMFSTSSSIRTLKETIESSNCNCDKKLKECKDEMSNALAFEMFSKRLVNMLLSHITFKEEDEIFSGKIYLEATSSQMQVLRDFGNVKVSIRSVDSILSDIIRKPSTSFFEDAISYSDLFLSIIQRNKSTCVGILIVMFILFVSRYIRWTRGAIILLVIDLIIVISFFMTWYQLVKEVEIKQTAKQMMFSKMPIECQPEKMNMMQYIMSKVSFQKLAWPMRWTVTLLLFIGVALLIIVLPFSLFGGSLGFGIGPLFHFTLGRQKEKIPVCDVKSPERIELIREVPTNIAIQRTESVNMKKADNKVVKQLLEKKDEQILHLNNILQESLKERGDSDDIDRCNEEIVKLELSDEKERKAIILKEEGSGDR